MTTDFSFILKEKGLLAWQEVSIQSHWECRSLPYGAKIARFIPEPCTMSGSLVNYKGMTQRNRRDETCAYS